MENNSLLFSSCHLELVILENSQFLAYYNNEKIDYVIQINGKKRSILNESRDIDEENLLLKIKSNKMLEKYLKNKSIMKVIFVKNRLINLLINE